MAEHLCVVCPQLRFGEPRVYERANVCEGCRSRLRTLLGETVEYYALLDLEKGSAAGDRVSGSRTAPLPLVATTLDLTMPARLQSVQDDLVPQYERVEVEVEVWRPAQPDVEEYELDKLLITHRRRKRDGNGWLAYGPSGDQVGDVSVLAMLESWARDWQTYAWAFLPEPTVSSLVAWLTERLTWACDHHPAVDDFASELREKVSALRPHGPRAELKKGVPCRECERVTLFRWPGSDFIECGSCPCLMTPEEYLRWTQLISAPEHQSWVEEIVAPQRDDAA